MKQPKKPYSNNTYFDGTSLESLGIVVERIHDDLPEARVEMVQYPGMRGSDFVGTTLGPREITLECRAFCDKWQDFENLKSKIYALVAKPTERKLQLRNHPGQYYMAHYDSFTEGDREGYTGIGAFELAFTASDPARYGADRAYVLKGTSKKSFDLGGTADATDMEIVIRGTRPSSNGFELTINGCRIQIPKSVFMPSYVFDTVYIHVAERIVEYYADRAGTSAWTTWPSLAPGRWTAQVTKGSCSSCTFSWKQRYL